MMFYRRQPSRRAFVESIIATTNITFTTASITTRARDGVAGLVLNNSYNTKSSTSGILLINRRRGIAGHSNNNRQQQQAASKTSLKCYWGKHCS